MALGPHPFLASPNKDKKGDWPTKRRYAALQQRNNQSSQRASGGFLHIKRVYLERENEAGAWGCAASTHLESIQRMTCLINKFMGDGRIFPSDTMHGGSYTLSQELHGSGL